ncbi:MAG TPA: NAD(P)H-dependent glycerol-3-phosphate dehydrogenase [Burkholderiaceae bacterium]|nr:NAD(P)H-dependent glycerol-3-phosphate dehydrogenase [Burkholderiaceae bacterium]
MARVGVIGGGAFGTAMACVLRRKRHEVWLWAREAEVVDAINRTRENALFLPGVTLPQGIVSTPRMAEAVRGADFVLLVPPAQHMRAVTSQLQPHLAAGTPVVSCSKGIERASCGLMSQVLAETLPQAPVAILSGPSFAAEIAIDRPAGVTLACEDPVQGARLEQAIGSARFRVYLADDVIGAQVSGVMKNVLAIACGIVTGKGLGNSMRAMLVARGLAEAVDLGLALGARLETFLGLSGIGDIDLSCNSPQSRNMSLGIALGQGRTLTQILAERITVQEGVHSSGAVAELGGRLGVDMPITRLVDRILNHGANPDLELDALMALPFGVERAVVPWLRRGTGDA